MSTVLHFLGVFLLAVGGVLILLYRAFSQLYYCSGPVYRREEWQTSVSVEEAIAFLAIALEEGGLASVACGNVVLARPQEWEWGISPRLALRIEEGQHGAIVVCESRLVLASLFVALGVLALLASDGNYVLAAAGLVCVPALALWLWKHEANRLTRLAPIRRRLAEIGLQICEHCGYDLHGLDASRGVCPECGRPREPGTALPTADYIRAQLLEREGRRRVLDIAKVVIGLPLSLLGPVVLGGAFWFAIGAILHVWIALKWVVLVMIVVATPLLFRLERQTGGDYLDQSLARLGEQFPDDAPFHLGRHVGMGGMTGQGLVALLTRPTSLAAAMTEFFLTGPRMVLSGGDHLRQAARLQSVSRYQAAGVLLALLRSQTGKSPAELLQASESVADIVPALAYLSLNGWIGVSERADRVWIFSESREVLMGA